MIVLPAWGTPETRRAGEFLGRTSIQFSATTPPSRTRELLTFEDPLEARAIDLVNAETLDLEDDRQLEIDDWNLGFDSRGILPSLSGRSRSTSTEGISRSWAGSRLRGAAGSRHPSNAPDTASLPRWIGDADPTAFDLCVGAKCTELLPAGGLEPGDGRGPRTPPPGTLDDRSGVLDDPVV
ncbi:MAG: hypothetical protein ACRBN8_40700 [Nannocystales bacterium]